MTTIYKPTPPTPAELEAAEREVERLRKLLIDATRTLNDLRSRKALAECRFQVGDVVRQTRITHDRAIDGKTFQVISVATDVYMGALLINVYAKHLTAKGVRGNKVRIYGDGWEKVQP